MKKIIISNFLIFFLLLIFIEILIRFTGLATVVGTSRNLFNHDEYLNFNNKNIEAKAFGKKVFTDNNGFRIPGDTYSYKENSQSILIIGDSTTFGVGVNEELSFIGLSRDYKKSINFYNASVIGHSINDYKKTIGKFKGLEFEKIFLFININDIHFASGVIQDNNEIKYEKDNYLTFIERIKKQRALGELNVFLRSKSALYMYLKSILSNPQQRYFELIYPYYLSDQITSKYKEYLIQIKDIVVKQEKEIFFFILPYEYQTRKKNCISKFLLPQKKINKYLNELNLNYYDFTQDFCNFNKPNKLYLPYDPTHLSKKGHEFVYSLLKKYLNI